MSIICHGITGKGKPCTRHVAKGKGEYCWMHNHQVANASSSNEPIPETVTMIECCICLEERCRDDQLTECQHAVCIDCLNRLRQSSCPICRRDLVLNFNGKQRIMDNIKKNRNRMIAESRRQHEAAARSIQAEQEVILPQRNILPPSRPDIIQEHRPINISHPHNDAIPIEEQRRQNNNNIRAMQDLITDVIRDNPTNIELLNSYLDIQERLNLLVL